ncbi:MAG: Ig-like domain-containing protein, partial [Gracilibacteraceae bacterium]|nr:Ig-like domain-containing protein [Gracilibacteraceae bacterium]
VAAPFEIAKRQISVLLRTDPPSGEPATGATVRLTAVIGNTIEAAPGTVTFSADGTVIASGVPARQVGKELIATAEWRQVLAGNQELTAEYVPAAQDNYNNAEDRISDYEVIKANQTGFKFPKTTLNKTYGDPDFLLPAAQGGQGGGGIDYYQIAGDTVISFYSISDDVAILQTGTSVIRAIKNGDSHYNPISADLTVVVAKKANDLAIDAPDTEFGLPVVPAVTVNESGGQLTYVWQGRGSTVYGPAAAPPTAIGDYVLTVSSAETVNYLAASASAEFRIIPCACVLDQANLSGGPIAIDYFKLQETQRLEPTWNFTACSVHGPIFALQYEFSGDHTGAKINGAYPNPVTLTVNDRAIGKKLTVKVKITHVPTGLAATQEAQFTVSKAARENSDAGGARQAYHKTKDGDVVVDISSILQDSGLSAVSVSPVRPGQKPATLTDGRDYKVENDQLVLKEGFMDTLPPGEQIIKIVTADGTEFLLHLDIAPGVLTVEQAGGSGLPAVTTPLTDLQLAGAVLTGQEMDRLNNGFDVKLELLISGLRIPADAAVVAAEAGSKKVGTLFDISLRKTVGTDQPVFISALPNKASVKLQVDLPSNLRGQPRYWLGRVEHPSGGKAYMSLLGARLQNGAALQFETNNFSTYAILYATSVVSIDSDSGGGGISAGSAGGGGSSAGGSGSGSSGGGNSVGVGGASTDTGSGAAIASPEPARPNPAPPAQPAPDAQSDRNEPAAKPPALLPANQARPIEDEADSDEPPPPGSNPKTGVPVGKLNDMGIFAALATLGAALMLRVDKRRRKLDPESNE